MFASHITTQTARTASATQNAALLRLSRPRQRRFREAAFALQLADRIRREGVGVQSGAKAQLLDDSCTVRGYDLEEDLHPSQRCQLVLPY